MRLSRQLDEHHPHGPLTDRIRRQRLQDAGVTIDTVCGQPARFEAGGIEELPLRIEAESAQHRLAGTCPIGVNSPVAASTAKPAMLLCPRFGAYKNFPDGPIWICEQEFCPV
jgi:hypothetical protein